MSDFEDLYKKMTEEEQVAITAVVDAALARLDNEEKEK